MNKSTKIALGLVTILVVLFYVYAYNDDRKLQGKVKEDFETMYPGYELLSSVVGEGNLAVVEVEIKFKKETGDTIYKETWPYWKVDEGWINRNEQEQRVNQANK